MSETNSSIEEDATMLSKLRREMAKVEQKKSEYLLEKVRRLNGAMYEIQTKKPDPEIVDKMLERYWDLLNKKTIPWYVEMQIRAGLHEIGFGCPYTGNDYALLYPEEQYPAAIPDPWGRLELPDCILVESVCSECGRLVGYYRYPKNSKKDFGILYGNTRKVKYEEVKTFNPIE